MMSSRSLITLGGVLSHLLCVNPQQDLQAFRHPKVVRDVNPRMHLQGFIFMICSNMVNIFVGHHCGVVSQSNQTPRSIGGDDE